MRATFENVMILVEGLPEGSVVSMAVDEEGLIIGGYGMVGWRDSRILLEDLTPKGLKMTVWLDDLAPCVFFVPHGSLGEGASISRMIVQIEQAALDAGAVLYTGALTSA